jgi:hypothetical protein
VRELLGRLSALDPNAESAVRVIAYFDALVERHAGVEAFVRGAAVLAGCPAGLHHPERHLYLRVDPQGHRLDPVSYSAGWPVAPLDDVDGAAVWLERSAEVTPTDAMILERLAAGARVVLERTRARASRRDPALVELLLDGNADADDRARAARRLGLAADVPVRAVASLPPEPSRRWSTELGGVGASLVTGDTDIPTRAGIGPAGPPADLPRSWHGALVALRLTGDGTDRHPGPTQLHYDDLGGLALLAETVPADAALVDDVRALDRIAEQLPWAIVTLNALAEHASRRRAAASLHIHHSTLQERATHLERALGYPLDTAAGHNRLYLALVLRRLHRNGDPPRL